MADQILCVSCPCEDQCKAQGCEEERLYYEEQIAQEERDLEQQQYEQMWREENGY